MTGQAAQPESLNPPPPPLGYARHHFDGAFIGPILPPPHPAVAGPPGPARSPVPEAILAIPLGTRRLVGQALDLLTRSDAGLRSASFYIGFLMLATIGPVAALFGLAAVTGPDAGFGSRASYGYGQQPPAWIWWLFLGFGPAFLGYLGASVEARALATAVIGGRAEGRPLRLRESIAIARQRFWSIFGAQLLIGLLTGSLSFVVSLVLLVTIGPVQAVSSGVSLVLGVILGAPFVYVPAGIVLGEAPAGEAIRRSVRLARTRKRLALVVALFSVVSQFIVVFGLGAGLDAVSRLVAGTGLDRSFPAPLVVPIAAALVFSFGTLTFLVEAIAAAPAVFAFEALTHYTAGLELGRRAPLVVRHAWDPWFTPGLAALIVLSLVTLVGGIAALRI
jgi:hypothetical protein